MRSAIFCYFALLTIAAFQAVSQELSLTAGPKVELDMSPRPLGQALMYVAKRTDQVLIIELGRGPSERMSVGLKGWFTAAEAFHQLLDPTGCQLKPLREGTWLVTAPASLPPRPPAKRFKSPAGDGLSQKLKIVLVTGTHLREQAPEDATLRVYSNADLALSGAITMEQFVERVPQNFQLLNAQTSTAAGISPLAGTNVARGEAMNLLGAGPGATLVLLDGLRVAPAGFDGEFVDISLLPFKALARVDVLTGGASATYGSDAVAGVVNFVLRRDFEGFQVAPYSALGGGGDQARGLSLLGGHQWDSGGWMASVERHEQQAINASSRDATVLPGGPIQVVPAQKTTSGVVTMHQTLGSWMELAADGIASERTYQQLYLSESPVITESRGRARLRGGNLHAVFQLPADWHSDFIGAYTQETETVTNFAGSVAQSFGTRSSIASIDWRADGTAFSIAGGPVELSVGGAWRRESFDDLQGRTGLARDVWGSFAEARVPIVGPDNARWWAQRIEWSFAVRHDDYRHGGAGDAASTNPKIGVLWSPRAELALRGGFSTSFRMAPLPLLHESTDKVLVLPLSDPSAPGTILETAYLTGANHALRPEVAQSWTAGIDVTPSSAFKLSATYFWLDYRNRIAVPPVVGPVTSALNQLATLGPYVNLSPSAADIQALYDRYSVLDPGSVGQGAIRAIFDSRAQNIAATRASGLEILATSILPTDVGEFQFRLESQYLAELSNRAAPTTGYLPAVNTVFNAPRWRGEGLASWSLKGLTVSTNVDVTGSYHDTLMPGAPSVGSGVVVGARVAYTTDDQFASMLLDHTTIALLIRNVFNRSPPYVAGLVGQTDGYDPSHASPLGRSLVLMVDKQW